MKLSLILLILLFTSCTFRSSEGSIQPSATEIEMSQPSERPTSTNPASETPSIPTEMPAAPPTPTPTETSALKPTATLPALTIAECVPKDTKREVGKVVSVIDGDTVDVSIDGLVFRVRYIGIDTPEKSDPFYEEATTANRELVGFQTVTLVTEITNTDQHNRLLRYLFVGDLFVNYELMSNGYAKNFSYPPDTACQQSFLEAQLKARTAGKGLWEPTATPTPTQAP